MTLYAACVGRFYEELAGGWWRAPRACSMEAGATVEVHEVPGAFELPLAAKYGADSGRYAGVVCLGAVIRGETDHYGYVARRGGLRDRARTARHPRARAPSAC